MRSLICVAIRKLIQVPFTSLGAIDASTVEKVLKIVTSDAEKGRLARVEARPHLSEILNLHDFEVRNVNFNGAGHAKSSCVKYRRSQNKLWSRKLGRTTRQPRTTKSRIAKTIWHITESGSVQKFSLMLRRLTFRQIGRAHV